MTGDRPPIQGDPGVEGGCLPYLVGFAGHLLLFLFLLWLAFTGLQGLGYL